MSYDNSLDRMLEGMNHRIALEAYNQLRSVDRLKGNPGEEPQRGLLSKGLIRDLGERRTWLLFKRHEYALTQEGVDRLRELKDYFAQNHGRTLVKRDVLIEG